MMTPESMAYINSQPPFLECEICNHANNPHLHQLKSSSFETEQKSKTANQTFKYNKLSDVIKHCVGVYLDFLDLTRLASTEKANRNMLKNKNKETLSLYLLAKLRTAKVLTPEAIYSYEKASGSPFTSLFFAQCHKLTHFTILTELSYHYEGEAVRKKRSFLTDEIIESALECCTTIRHLSVNLGCISFDELNSIVTKCPNLKQLTIIGDANISYNLDLNYDPLTRSTLVKIINTSKSLEYLGILHTLLTAGTIYDTLHVKEVSQILKRWIHIKLLLPSPYLNVAV